MPDLLSEGEDGVMAEAHLDHPGEIKWFPGKGPVPVLGPCPHATCSHNMGAAVAYGPDYDHYVLDECSVPAEENGCAGTCRAWMAEYPQPRDGVRYKQAPFLHVELTAAPTGPDPRTDAAVGPDDEVRHCIECGAVCDMRIQVCECGPDCPLPPVHR